MSAGFHSGNISGLTVFPTGRDGGTPFSQKFAHSPPPGKIPIQ